MMMLTKKNRNDLPTLYSQDGTDATAYVKFFTPDGQWTWYATEFDGEDTFFGLVQGFDEELGYFRLSELEAARGPLGMKIERDRHFRPTKLSELRRRETEDSPEDLAAMAEFDAA